MEVGAAVAAAVVDGEVRSRAWRRFSCHAEVAETLLKNTKTPVRPELATMKRHTEAGKEKATATATATATAIAIVVVIVLVFAIAAGIVTQALGRSPLQQAGAKAAPWCAGR